MSRIAQVIVLAADADEVMEPLTRPDESRSWGGHFERLDQPIDWGWVIEFYRVRSRSGLLRHLESLAWPHPASVQVLIRDEEDDCFGLWMMRDGELVEIALPGHRRLHPRRPVMSSRPALACCGGQKRPCQPASQPSARTRAPPGRAHRPRLQCQPGLDNSLDHPRPHPHPRPRLREAASSDLPFVFRGERSYMEEIEPAHLASWTQAIDRNLDLWIKNLERTVILEVDGEPVGYAMWTSAADTATLITIHVADAMRRRGLGAELMTWFSDSAQKAGHRVLELGVHHGNPARALYERSQYTLIGEDGDYLLFQRRLS
ncbi:N-acetyltransferase family protein [Streptacidiphilus sp. PAMC 29251]